MTNKKIQCIFHAFFLSPEPIGSVRPKVNMESELSSVRVYLSENFSLKCPAQSYPIPTYR